MKAIYDPRTDTLTLELKPGPVAESDEGKPGVILDYDEAGNLVGIEILDASKRVAGVRTMEFHSDDWCKLWGERQDLAIEHHLRAPSDPPE